MKSRSVLIRVCIYIAMTFLLIFLEPKVSNVLLGSIYWLLYIVAIVVLVSWRTFNCIWVCDECGEKFKISFWASIKSFSIISIKNKLYHRKLYCHKCNKKTWCRCVFQE
ncbi:hypothetical protein KPL37_03775 [Clostridium frigoris]|uniref:Zinc-ribbon 15 domain-containing protein n=1 Tax=Clostridium frigoris TaxID=205327 RepID=A0ABS6BPP6_9CLOT|nr:hypothetical protein [Clostridium frigoris]MBU3158883.1 hypothetical protein [Clostridium frigoris]